MAKVNQIWLLGVFALLTACSEKPYETLYYDFSGEEGVFIVNEGNFMYGNSSLSFYSPASGRVYNDLFFARNGAPLGDVAFSMQIRDRLAWLVVNNSGKIIRFNPDNIRFVDVIGGFTSPRYMAFIPGDKAYVTDLYSPYISLISTVDGRRLDSIDLAIPSDLPRHTSEQMLVLGEYALVNAWSYDNMLFKINIQKNKVVDSLQVPLQPASMVADEEGYVWVLTDGGYAGHPMGEEPATLCKIALNPLRLLEVLRFESGEHPRELALSTDGEFLYYLNTDLYRLAVGSRELPQFPFINYAEGGNPAGWFALGVDTQRGEIYLSDPLDYAQNGRVYRFSETGQPLDTLSVGINPGFFCFKNQ